VRLSIGAHQWRAPLTIIADPRVKVSAQDFAVQFATAQRLAEACDASTGALLESRSLRAQLKQLMPKGSGPVRDQMRMLDTHIAELLEPADDSAPPRRGLERLNGDAATLYGQINGVDAAPTAVQAAETERASADWRVLEQAWRRIHDEEVPALNHALAQARLTQLVPDSEPPRDLNFADED
jgi:hypothetical protein